MRKGCRGSRHGLRATLCGDLPLLQMNCTRTQYVMRASDIHKRADTRNDRIRFISHDPIYSQYSDLVPVPVTIKVRFVAEDSRTHRHRLGKRILNKSMLHNQGAAFSAKNRCFGLDTYCERWTADA